MDEIRYVGRMRIRNCKTIETCSLFKCPKCGKYVIKIRCNGLRDKTCGCVRTGFYKNSDGYIQKHMPSHPRGRHRGYLLYHRLLMEEKIGRPLKEDEVVHHIDGNRDNNNIENLMLMSKAKHFSLHNRGEQSHFSKLTKEDVREIKIHLAYGDTAISIAIKYSVNPMTIYNIANNKTWKHIS
jgi:hypothetical protein